MKPKTIALLSFGIIIGIVFLQNTQVVSIRFLFWEISMSRIVLVPLIVLIGFGIGFFVGRHTVIKKEKGYAGE